MEIPDHMRIAIERVYNRCKNKLNVFDDHELSTYIQEVNEFKNSLEASIGLVELEHLLSDEIIDENELHERICREIQQQCTVPLPGPEKKRKIVTHTAHFLQDVKLFYKELGVSAYFTIAMKHKISQNDTQNTSRIMGQSGGIVVRSYKELVPNDLRSNTEILNSLIESNVPYPDIDLQQKITTYKTKKRALDRLRTRKKSSRDTMNSTYNESVSMSNIELSNLYSTHLAIKFFGLRLNEGITSSSNFIERVTGYLDIIIFLRKLDLMCAKRRYYRVIPGEHTERDGDGDGEQLHADFIDVLAGLRLLCDYLSAINSL